MRPGGLRSDELGPDELRSDELRSDELMADVLWSDELKFDGLGSYEIRMAKIFNKDTGIAYQVIKSCYQLNKWSFQL